MASTGLLIGLGALGLGALYLSRKAATPAGGTSACDALCAAAATQGIPAELCKQGVSYRACQAAGGLWDALSSFVSGPDWAAMDADNIKLNGEVELALGPLGDRTVEPVTRSAALHGTVLRFKNGGVPFKGFPGWEKCAAGTHNMLSDGPLLTLDPTSGKWVTMIAANAFTGGSGDATSAGPFAANRKVTLPAISSSGNKLAGGLGLGAAKSIDELAFPVPLSSGEQGFYAQGVAFKCPAGTSPQWKLHDKRTGGGPPPCVAADGSGGWVSSGPQAGAGYATGTQTQVAACTDPSFTWVNDGGGAGHWAKLGVGQTRNLAGSPCAPSSPVGSGRAPLPADRDLASFLSSVVTGGPRT